MSEQGQTTDVLEPKKKSKKGSKKMARAALAKKQNGLAPSKKGLNGSKPSQLGSARGIESMFARAGRHNRSDKRREPEDVERAAPSHW